MRASTSESRSGGASWNWGLARDDAEALAGETIVEGQLYYLFLKEEFLTAMDPWGPES